MKEEIYLCNKLVGDIKGNFFIHSYQRGYRWGKDEVLRLLEDIEKSDSKFYCLQPLVVKKQDDEYELIEGQQRLTTLYLVYLCMSEITGGYHKNENFTIDYKIREKSKEFLENIDISRENENIDFYYLSNAYKTIKEWFSNKRRSDIDKFNAYLDEKARFIWYEVDSSINSIDLFTRLNVGKILLTNAELVKAMILSKNSDYSMTEREKEEKQKEISLQWDNIEKELNNNRLWGFLTNSAYNEYQTRIDLVLDLYVNKPNDSKEKYYTFFEIDKLKNEKSLIDIWNEIVHTFLILKDWYENHELYHKIGYLITSNSMTLNEIYNIGIDVNKDEFIKTLDNKIKESINIKKSYDELSYVNDKSDIFRLLLLFNVESVRKNGKQSEWFAFDKFKFGENGKETWSLEHIDAQNFQGFNKVEVQKEWLTNHLKSLKNLGNIDEAFLKKVELALENKISGSEFENLRKEIINKFRNESNIDYLDSIYNLALLNVSDNAALSNSVFDVKRNRII